MKAPPSTGFECRTSPTLVAMTVVVATLAVVAVGISGVPNWLHRLLLALVAASAVHGLYKALRPRVQSLLWRGDGTVELHLRDRVLEDGGEVQGAMQAARVMGPLIVLTLRWRPRERATLWLLPDNLDADARRRLRMRLGASGAGVPTSGNADSG